jgi:hypothetical protein
MSKYQRLTQIEAGPLTASGAKIITHQFDGSAGGINWGKSYMEVETQFLDSAGNPYTGGVVNLMDFTSEIEYSPSAILQNVRLSHSAAGVLEENRNVNVHNQTELYVTKSNAELQTKFAEGFGGVTTDTNGVGHMIIPCSDILGMGRMETTTMKVAGEDGVEVDKLIPYVFPLDKRGGDCTLRCELEDQASLFSSPNPIIGTGNPVVALTAADIAAPLAVTPISSLQIQQTFLNAATQALFLSVDRPASVSYTLNGVNLKVPVVIQAIAAAGGAYPSAPGVVTFDRVWVNQPVGQAVSAISLNLDDQAKITGPSVGLAAQAQAATTNITIPNAKVSDFVIGADYTSIVNAVLGANPGQTRILSTEATLNTATVNAVTADNVDLVFATAILPAIPQTAADNNSATFLYLQKTPLVASIRQVALNLYRQPSPNNAPFEYKTLSLEKAIVPSGITQYQNQFQLESSLTGFKMLIPAQNTLVSALQEGFLSSYRVAIQNKDTTNRDMVLDPDQNCQAYLDRLKLFYGNALHNLNRNLGSTTQADGQQYLSIIAEKYNSVGGDMVDLRYQFGNARAPPVITTNTLFLFKDKVMTV